MEEFNLLKQINKEIQDFQSKQIQIVPGFSFNQYDTLNTIVFYHNSKFTSGDIDDEGDRKYFFNITKNPCKVFTKAIDFDTKNIRLLTTGGGDPLKTWFMERDLKYWMRDKQFGKTLNKIFKDLPIYGSVVLKIINGTPYFVDLRNFIVEQTADTLDNSSYIIEVHRFSVPAFRKVAEEMGWDKDKVDETITLFRQMKDAAQIRVFERYGEVEEDSKWVYKKVYWADVGEDEYDNRGDLIAEHKGVELSSTEVSSHPYREIHAEKIPGRWLGVGVVETLFEPQIKQNETANLESKSAYFLSLHVFQTRDQAFNRNLKGGVKNGEVFNVDSELTEVNISDRNGAFFNEQTRKWQLNRDEMTFAYDAVQGERSPAGTPLGSTEISIGQTLSYFEGIQENVALDIKEILYKDILPTFEKEAKNEHTLRLVGKDLDQYISMVKNDLVAKEVIRMIIETDTFPTNADRDVIGMAIEESIKKEKEKLITVPKGFYDGLKYDVDIDITGESVDTRIRYATKFALLQAATADPTIMSPEEKRNLIMSMSEDGGINPADIWTAGVQNMQQAQIPNSRAGGGVSAPALDAELAGEGVATV